MEMRTSGVEQKSTTGLTDFERVIGNHINDEVKRVVAEQQNKLPTTVQQYLEAEHQTETKVMTNRIDEAVEAGVQKLIPRIQLAATNSVTTSSTTRKACIERRLNEQLTTTGMAATTGMHGSS